MFDAAKMIESEFKSTVFKAITRYGKKYSTPEESIRICFSLDEGAQNVYKIFVSDGKQSAFKEQVTFDDLLNVKLDILGKGKKVPPIINVALLVFNDENVMPENAAQIIMSKYRDSKDNDIFRMCLYNKNVYVKDVTVTQIVEILTKMAEQ